MGKAMAELMKMIASVTRFEVIDDQLGRVYSNKPCKIELSFQDNSRTLKVFVKHTE